MIKNKTLASIFTLFLLLPIAFIGCSSGSSESVLSTTPVRSSQSIKILPSSYDFGSVTPGNSPAPLEAEIVNQGSGAMSVSNIFLSDTINFSLDLSGGSNPCNKINPTIPAGGNCTVEVVFQPTLDASFDANLTITSNDPVAPEDDVMMTGRREPISELNVRINQIKSDEASCPNPGSEVTAYVSVTDQGGYPVKGLELDVNNFTVTETAGGYAGPPDDPVEFVENISTISVALVMDYSESINKEEDNVDDMEDAVTAFIYDLGVVDEAEIIKFADDVVVVQPFTNDKNLLITAVQTPLNGAYTSLFDAVERAVDDTAQRLLKDRKAVIVVTDGKDNSSSIGIDPLIAYALLNNVPLFTVGLGDLSVDSISDLKKMANDTGGQYYKATTSDNLRTVYQQLSQILFVDQYILKYTSDLGAGVTANLAIGATLGGVMVITGNDTKEITSCP